MLKAYQWQQNTAMALRTTVFLSEWIERLVLQWTLHWKGLTPSWPFLLVGKQEKHTERCELGCYRGCNVERIHVVDCVGWGCWPKAAPSQSTGSALARWIGGTVISWEQQYSQFKIHNFSTVPLYRGWHHICAGCALGLILQNNRGCVHLATPVVTVAASSMADVQYAAVLPMEAWSPPYLKGLGVPVLCISPAIGVELLMFLYEKGDKKQFLGGVF